MSAVHPRSHRKRVVLAGLLLAGATSCGSKEEQAPKPPPPLVEDLLSPPDSCAFECSSQATCEPKGYQCPALAPWDEISHAEACPKWDGKSFPAITGKCTASVPTGEAAKRDGVDPADSTTTILPTGQRTKPTGKVSVFDDYKGQFPTNVVSVPGSDLVIVVDGGIQEQSVRLVDTALIGSPAPAKPVVGSEKFTGSTSVNYGAAIVPGSTPLRVYVSGSAGSIVYAFDVDVAAKTLTRKSSEDIKVTLPPDKPKGGGLAGGYYLSGIAVSPDGKRLYAGTAAAPSGTTPVFEIDLATKKVSKTFDLGSREVFAVTFHPVDTEGRYVWASIWDGSRIDVIDTTTSSVRSINVGKNPQAFAPIGTRYLAVVASDGDELSILDTLPAGGGEVLKLPVAATSKNHGFSPSGVAYDDTAKRLYVTLAGLNAVAAFDVTDPGSGPPGLLPAGMIGTEWWPTAITLRADGSLVVLNGKGRGTGANPIPFKPSEGDITDRMRGSIQLVPTPTAKTLSDGNAVVEAATQVGNLGGTSKVDCAGAPYDFPVPSTNTDGPSKLIKHVVFVVKENKTFDGVLGDMPGVEGDPKLVMAPGKMDSVFGNQRKVGTTFTQFDNYYTSAEQSIQGHVWTAYGLTSEFIERTWLVNWGRGFRSIPTAGITPVGSPIEGSIFSWLQREGVLFDDMGEPVGSAGDDGKSPKNWGLDGAYPGVFYAMDRPDSQKSCYIVARARASCDLRPFTYAIQPNDHTNGSSAGSPTPETYIAMGDEGTGILIDGLSKSPAWADTLVIVTMDDPQDGGDHIDAHRTPLWMASPWIKRGYVSKGHYDTSSIHKLIANIFGKPYLNEEVARASLPLDAFTSTPDYTPFEHLPRTTPLACNPGGTKAATEAAMSGWDTSQPDQAPGIGRQIWEHFHPDGTPAPAGLDDD
jgi:hypothetical protein